MTTTDGNEALVTYEPAAPPAPATVGLFNTDDPDIVLARAVKCADVLKDVIVKKQLALKIGSSEYIKVEGWTTLGALVGVFPKVEWTRQVGEGDDAGWEAAVIVVNSLGVEIGRAEAQCLRSERNWKNRDDFALRSMAQTRAMGKALRMPLGFIAVLAGYSATPAEEMPVVPGREEVPFEDSPAAEPAPGGGATQPALRLEAKVTELLELAARLGEQAHDVTVGKIAEKRDEGTLTGRWVEDQIRRAKAKLPAEEPPQFEIPESAKK
jgi:hypothetical protein